MGKGKERKPPGLGEQEERKKGERKTILNLVVLTHWQRTMDLTSTWRHTTNIYRVQAGWVSQSTEFKRETNRK